MTPLKITQSQNLILQGVLGILLSSAISAISAVAQYLLRGGHVDVGVALSIGVAAFATIFGAALRAYVPTHIKELLQAKDDTIAQLSQRAQAAEQRVQAQPDMQVALTQLAQQQQTQTHTVAQQLAQSVAESVQKAVAEVVPTQSIAPQTPVNVVINPATPMTATVSHPSQDIVNAQAPSAPVATPPDVSQVNTTSMPAVPSSVPNPLADFLEVNPDNDDTQTKVQVVQAQRRVS